MSEPTITQPIVTEVQEPSGEKDFVSAALASMTEEPAKPEAPHKEAPKAEAPAETKTEKQEKKPSIPEELFTPSKKEEPEKKAEPEEDLPMPNFAKDDKKSRANWEAANKARAELRAKYEETQKKLVEAEARGKNTAELEAKIAKLEADYQAAQAKASEYQKLVQQVNIEIDPEFRKNYVDGRKKLIGEARAIAEESGLDPKAVEVALNLQGKSRVEALDTAVEGMSSFQQGRLGDVINKLNRLDTEAAEQRSNPDDYLRRREEQQAIREREEQKQFAETMSRAFTDALREASVESVLLKKLDGVDWWNNEVDESLTKAREFWDGNTDPKAAAKMAIRAMVAERAERAFVEMRAERDTHKERADKAEAELAKLYGKGPKLGDGGSPAKHDATMGFADRVISDANL